MKVGNLEINDNWLEWLRIHRPKAVTQDGTQIKLSEAVVLLALNKTIDKVEKLKNPSKAQVYAIFYREVTSLVKRIYDAMDDALLQIDYNVSEIK